MKPANFTLEVPGMKYPTFDSFHSYEEAEQGAREWLRERAEIYGSDYTECYVVERQALVRRVVEMETEKL